MTSINTTWKQLHHSGVIAVVQITDSQLALPIAEALLAGGVHFIEVTLRSDAALESIQRIAEKLPDMHVGAGTVLSIEQFDKAVAAGAQFIFSPGFEPTLAEYASKQNTPYIPGIASASELQQAHVLGFDTVKCFPAEVCGGASLIRSLHGPFPHMRFCPTGGIRPDNMSSYLEQQAVFAVGGSWLVTSDIVSRQAWEEISQRAEEAQRIYQQSRQAT
jgi:2-dehydro-3-deoxyphosphogluconate aldolase / (4S)-4-hydroxy-2-oxoglutarate aldolase